MRDKIVQFIYDYLDWAYCDNCRYNFEDEDSEKCDCCYRKSIYWEISKETAEVLADGIMDIIKEVKYE